ncbi:hypothetical protein LB504_008724 [Fusarium proliferatum]|nr:hypothetical protein LB504_008724 [Fusarium proliferatum]
MPRIDRIMVLEINALPIAQHAALGLVELDQVSQVPRSDPVLIVNAVTVYVYVYVYSQVLTHRARVVPTTSPFLAPSRPQRLVPVGGLCWCLLGALSGVSVDCLGRHLVPGGALFLCLRLGVTCANLGTAPPSLHHEPLLFTISIAARTRLRRRRRPCIKRLDAGAHNFAGADVTCRLPPSYKSLFLNRRPAAPLVSATLDHDPASEHQQELSAHKTPRPPHLLPSFAKPRHFVFFCQRGEAFKRNDISLVRLCDKLQRSSNQHPRLHPTAYRSPTNVFRDPIANMAGLFQRVYNWLMRMFWAMEMEVTMVGLQNAGKTSLLRVLAGGEFTLDSIPTVGFNMKKVQRGHVTLKCWDIGGQPRFRTMWERYCRGVSAIVFIVDIADTPLIPQAKEELHDLMSRKSLEGIPLLILGNKSDLPDKLSVDELIDELDLKSIRGREVCCYGISAKEETNLDAVVEFLMKYATRP